MTKTPWASDWSVGIRVWIERAGTAVLGQGRAELLAAIDRHRSITKGAKAVGISYRKAWSLVQEVNAAAGEPLVEAAVGGVKGGGTELTPRGKFALKVYDELRRSLYGAAAGALQQAVSPEADSTACIHLAAAISLQEALGQLLAEYALRAPAVKVRAVFGASNELADHVLAGAPCDIFISAEQTEIERLAGANLLVPDSRRSVATNGLAAIGRSDKIGVRKASDILSARIKHVALAEPACPLGRYSQTYLQSEGVYEALLPKVLHVNNSRAVPAAVASGAAEVGLAFASDAARSEDCQTLFRVPRSRAAAQYMAAILKRGQRQDDAKALLAFFTSTAATVSFRRCGFRPTSEEPRKTRSTRNGKNR